MTAVTFNTLQFATKLKEAGLPEKQAEVLANSFGEVLQVNLKDLVTEQQLNKAVSDLKQEISQTRQELKQDIAQVKQELKQDLKSVETRLDAKIDISISKLTSEIQLLKWMTGTMFAGVIAILIRLFFFRVV